MSQAVPQHKEQQMVRLSGHYLQTMLTTQSIIFLQSKISLKPQEDWFGISKLTTILCFMVTQKDLKVVDLTRRLTRINSLTHLSLLRVLKRFNRIWC